MKLSSALTQLRGMTAADQVPTLTESDLIGLLHSCRIPDCNGNPIEDVTEWEANASYVKGDRVIGSDGFGHVCTEEGITDVTAPAWGETTADGTVSWTRDTEASWIPTYDVNRAAMEAWTMKAAKASSMIGFSSEGARYSREQYLANCQTMIDLYARRIVHTVSTRPKRKRRSRA